MSDRPIPRELEQRLGAYAAARREVDTRLRARGPDPAPGDLYALPAHGGILLNWVVLEAAGGRVRLAPADERSFAGPTDLVVGHGTGELCLRLAVRIEAAADHLPAAQRIGVLDDDDLAAARDHIRSLRPDRAAASPGEDDEQQDWRRRVARAGRILERFLRDGVVELRLDEFRRQPAVPGAADPEAPETPAARLAAAPGRVGEELRRIHGLLDSAFLVDELDCGAAGCVQLVATRRGLALLFVAEESGIEPPPVARCTPAGATAPMSWQQAPGRRTWRTHLEVDWAIDRPRLRFGGARALLVEITGSPRAF